MTGIQVGSVHRRKKSSTQDSRHGYIFYNGERDAAVTVACLRTTLLQQHTIFLLFVFSQTCSRAEPSSPKQCLVTTDFIGELDWEVVWIEICLLHLLPCFQFLIRVIPLSKNLGCPIFVSFHNFF